MYREFHKRVVRKPPECRNVVLPSSSATITVIASYSLGFAMAASTAPTDPTSLLTGATTPRADRISFVAGTTLAFPDSFIVPAPPTAPTVVTKKTAVSLHYVPSHLQDYEKTIRTRTAVSVSLHLRGFYRCDVK